MFGSSAAPGKDERRAECREAPAVATHPGIPYRSFAMARLHGQLQEAVGADLGDQVGIAHVQAPEASLDLDLPHAGRADEDRVRGVRHGRPRCR
jgi:hypothetical protein